MYACLLNLTLSVESGPKRQRSAWHLAPDSTLSVAFERGPFSFFLRDRPVRAGTLSPPTQERPMTRPANVPRGSRGTNRGRGNPPCCADAPDLECPQHAQLRRQRQRQEARASNAASPAPQRRPGQPTQSPTLPD